MLELVSVRLAGSNIEDIGEGFVVKRKKNMYGRLNLTLDEVYKKLIKEEAAQRPEQYL